MSWNPLALPKQSAAKRIPIKPTAVNIPPGALPSWSSLPYEAKLPIPHCPKGELCLSYAKIGQSRFKTHVSRDFELTDPCNYDHPSTEYNPLTDPNLKDFFLTTDRYKRLVRTGKISPEGRVKCSLAEYNTYRRYLYKLWGIEVSRLNKAQLKEERIRLETRLSEHHEPTKVTVPEEFTKELSDWESQPCPKKTDTDTVKKSHHPHGFGHGHSSSDKRWHEYQKGLKKTYGKDYSKVSKWLNDSTRCYRNVTERQLVERKSKEKKVLEHYGELREHSQQLLIEQQRVREREKVIQGKLKEQRARDFQLLWDKDQKKLSESKMMRHSRLQEECNKVSERMRKFRARREECLEDFDEEKPTEEDARELIQSAMAILASRESKQKQESPPTVKSEAVEESSSPSVADELPADGESSSASDSLIEKLKHFPAITPGIDSKKTETRLRDLGFAIESHLSSAIEVDAKEGEKESDVSIDMPSDEEMAEFLQKLKSSGGDLLDKTKLKCIQNIQNCVKSVLDMCKSSEEVFRNRKIIMTHFNDARTELTKIGCDVSFFEKVDPTKNRHTTLIYLRWIINIAIKVNCQNRALLDSSVKKLKVDLSDIERQIDVGKVKLKKTQEKAAKEEEYKKKEIARGKIFKAMGKSEQSDQTDRIEDSEAIGESSDSDGLKLEDENFGVSVTDDASSRKDSSSKQDLENDETVISEQHEASSSSGQSDDVEEMFKKVYEDGMLTLSLEDRKIAAEGKELEIQSDEERKLMSSEEQDKDKVKDDSSKEETNNQASKKLTDDINLSEKELQENIEDQAVTGTHDVVESSDEAQKDIPDIKLINPNLSTFMANTSDTSVFMEKLGVSEIFDGTAVNGKSKESDRSQKDQSSSEDPTSDNKNTRPSTSKETEEDSKGSEKKNEYIVNFCTVTYATPLAKRLISLNFPEKKISAPFKDSSSMFNFVCKKSFEERNGGWLLKTHARQNANDLLDLHYQELKLKVLLKKKKVKLLKDSEHYEEKLKARQMQLDGEAYLQEDSEDFLQKFKWSRSANKEIVSTGNDRREDLRVKTCLALRENMNKIRNSVLNETLGKTFEERCEALCNDSLLNCQNSKMADVTSTFTSDRDEHVNNIRKVILNEKLGKTFEERCEAWSNANLLNQQKSKLPDTTSEYFLSGNEYVHEGVKVVLLHEKTTIPTKPEFPVQKTFVFNKKIIGQDYEIKCAGKAIITVTPMPLKEDEFTDADLMSEFLKDQETSDAIRKLRDFIPTFGDLFTPDVTTKENDVKSNEIMACADRYISTESKEQDGQVTGATTSDQDKNVYTSTDSKEQDGQASGATTSEVDENVYTSIDSMEQDHLRKKSIIPEKHINDYDPEAECLKIAVLMEDGLPVDLNIHSAQGSISNTLSEMCIAISEKLESELENPDFIPRIIADSIQRDVSVDQYTKLMSSLASEVKWIERGEINFHECYIGEPVAKWVTFVICNTEMINVCDIACYPGKISMHVQELVQKELLYSEDEVDQSRMEFVSSDVLSNLRKRLQSPLLAVRAQVTPSTETKQKEIIFTDLLTEEGLDRHSKIKDLAKRAIIFDVRKEDFLVSSEEDYVITEFIPPVMEDDITEPVYNTLPSCESDSEATSSEAAYEGEIKIVKITHKSMHADYLRRQEKRRALTKLQKASACILALNKSIPEFAAADHFNMADEKVMNPFAMTVPARRDSLSFRTYLSSDFIEECTIDTKRLQLKSSSEDQNLRQFEKVEKISKLTEDNKELQDFHDQFSEKDRIHTLWKKVGQEVQHFQSSDIAGSSMSAMPPHSTDLKHLTSKSNQVEDSKLRRFSLIHSADFKNIMETERQKLKESSDEKS